LFSICVNLRNLWIKIHPQISQIYADEDNRDETPFDRARI